jgi:hypothetical protein
MTVADVGHRISHHIRRPGNLVMNNVPDSVNNVPDSVNHGRRRFLGAAGAAALAIGATITSPPSAAWRA